MLRTSPLWKILPLCLLAHASLALAQQAAPSAAPPKLERIEEGSDQPITVTPPRSTGGSKVTEKKEGGKVTEVQVKAGPSTYTMKPHSPAGNAQAGDATAGTLRAPQWKVMEFDLSRKKKTDKEDVPEAAPVPPPPPPKPAK